MTRDLNYEINNIAYDEYLTKEEGGGIKCKNYKVCNSLLPHYWFEINNNYLCTNCYIMFGSWSINTNKEILNTNKGILDTINNDIEPVGT